MSKDGRSIEERVILKMMGLGFIDIRADAGKEVGTNKERMKAYIISDLYHNVPGSLAHGVDASEILKEIHERAKRHGVERYVINAEAWARRSSEKE